MKDWRNRRAAGSLTVEASFVMGILLFSMFPWRYCSASAFPFMIRWWGMRC